ncbi:toll/interleukin-1 receptor domain-containing protein [Aequorivita echinoideorum]|uniref:TIR domain-containing protein n=1 Tax=Aequorivita echinoideorum TaxID=1549647 RepID=A0ABS5S629_9FLAO|nr:toll/interleukin-1 receptor domain-containing protein [Aequorivita echinoideorum]MBT0608672.1 TIR domain-containing protein [Aequorivita echinoideorum]
MAAKIFISYSRRDTAYVSTLVEALRKQGFEVWFDKNIRTGTDWDDTIEEELKRADAVVLILSKTSVESENVKDEISYAIGLDKPVNPIKIEDCDVPMRLARKQFVDFTVMGPELGFERLVKDLRINLNESSVNVVKNTFQPPKQQISDSGNRKNSKSIKPYIIGGVSAIFLLFVLILIFTPPEETTTDEEPIEVSTEENDWKTVYDKHNLDNYISYLYKYGKTAKYYEAAYTEINGLMGNEGTVWYGTKGGEMHCAKYLFYAGDANSPPQIEDIITPIYRAELFEGKNYAQNGRYVQPGQKLLVQEVWVDMNNNIWAGVRFK